MDELHFELSGAQRQALWALPTPCFLVDEKIIEDNLKILQQIQIRTGCRMLLAQKAFSMYYLYQKIGQQLWGAAASGLNEARLAREQMNKQVHTFSPAYRPDEFDEILSLSDHIIFNSASQWERFAPQALAAGRSCGIRVNPELSTGDHAVYDPCAPFSRLGATAPSLEGASLDGLEGLHFHTLCEQDAGALVDTLGAVREKFGDLLSRVKWINLGGGHHITRSGYNIEMLEAALKVLKSTYGVQVYLEPGEAVALGAGFLVSRVLDVVHNGMDIAILDTSAACHMPDVLEMPYRPQIEGAGEPNGLAHTYRLSGPTCLAGDIIGDYSFDHELEVGERIIFFDMAHYSMVKTNTFNGINLPSIALLESSGKLQIVRRFGYDDFKSRLSGGQRLAPPPQMPSPYGGY